MTTSPNHSWAPAGQGCPESYDPNPSTMAIATGLQLPSGFSAVADDPDLGPSMAMSLG